MTAGDTIKNRPLSATNGSRLPEMIKLAVGAKVHGDNKCRHGEEHCKWGLVVEIIEVLCLT